MMNICLNVSTKAFKIYLSFFKGNIKHAQRSLYGLSKTPVLFLTVILDML